MYRNIPNLNEYRHTFEESGLNFPLKPIPYLEEGMMKTLPTPNNDRIGWPWTIETSPNVYNNEISWPKISIVIPSYNQASFIEEAIRSVLLQNYPNLELIIVDGGSKDETVPILEQYSNWISYWHSKPDRGQGHAINTGFSLASGDYFGWLNSDDFYNVNSFYILAEKILKYKKEFYYGSSYSCEEDRSKYYFEKGLWIVDPILRYGGITPSHSSFWNSKIHQPIDEGINCAIDYELWPRLIVNRTKCFVNYPIGTIRRQEESKSANLRWRERWEEDAQRIKAIYGEFKPSINQKIAHRLSKFLKSIITTDPKLY